MGSTNRKQIKDGTFNGKITLTGGEPLMQKEALVELLKELKGLDVIVYTGHQKEFQIEYSADMYIWQEIIEELKILFQSNVPIFGICLGHQLMALANGADTKKMHYGHRGANHPVKDLKTGKVYISSQNHGYMVMEDTLNRDIAEVSFINVNDKTVEGVHYLGKNVMTVQFHPEACPGPNDSSYLFREFMTMMEVSKYA